MPTLSLIQHAVREIMSPRRSLRVPEPDLIMDDPAKVEAFHQAGKAGGVMGLAYLFHAAHVSEVIRPGETAVDLGCGPANQLSMIAQFNPDVSFIGVDLSSEMLARADRNLRDLSAANVRLQEGDITDLRRFADHSVDAVFSTIVLHHLPDRDALYRCFAEIGRVLKPGGGLYLADLGHLKTDQMIRYFAYQYVDRQPPLFTLDYENSLRAAFFPDEWQEGHARHLRGFGAFHAVFLVPYMVAIKSPARRRIEGGLRHGLDEFRRSLPRHHQRDLKDLVTFFRLGGLRSQMFGR